MWQALVATNHFSHVSIASLWNFGRDSIFIFYMLWKSNFQCTNTWTGTFTLYWFALLGKNKWLLKLYEYILRPTAQVMLTWMSTISYLEDQVETLTSMLRLWGMFSLPWLYIMPPHLSFKSCACRHEVREVMSMLDSGPGLFSPGCHAWYLFHLVVVEGNVRDGAEETRTTLQTEKERERLNKHFHSTF